MTDCTAIEAKLAEAENAYHQLMTGQSVRVFVDQNGERVEYSAANKQSLINYIAQLRSSIINGCDTTATTNKPLRFYL